MKFLLRRPSPVVASEAMRAKLHAAWHRSQSDRRQLSCGAVSGGFAKHLVPLLALVMALASLPLAAHEVRPAFLQIVETAPERFDVLWKQPIVQDRRLPIDPILPGGPANRWRSRRRGSSAAPCCSNGRWPAPSMRAASTFAAWRAP